jgi:hypothetical protein
VEVAIGRVKGVLIPDEARRREQAREACLQAAGALDMVMMIRMRKRESYVERRRWGKRTTKTRAYLISRLFPPLVSPK